MRLGKRNVGVVLDDALAFYRVDFRNLMKLALLTVFPVALVLGIAQDFYYRGYFEMLALEAPGLGTDLLVSYGVIAFGAVAMFFVRALFDCAILSAAPGLLYGVKTDYREMLRNGRRRWGWYLLVQFVVGIIVAAAGTFTFFLLYAGALFAAAAFALAPVVTVIEGGDLGYALSRSWALVKGNIWRVAGYVILLAALTGAFQWALGSPVIIRQVVSIAQNPDAILAPIPVPWKIAEGLVLGLAETLPAPFTTLAAFSLYVDLRVRSEGMDLVMRARELTGAA